MKEIRRSEALSRVTRMLEAHMASTSGQSSQNGTPRSGFAVQAGASLTFKGTASKLFASDYMHGHQYSM